MTLASIGSLPAQAQLSDGSTFTLFLECNNDGSALVVGSNAIFEGWQYASDARYENTDGHFYDIAGISLKQTADELYVVLNGNTPLMGTGYDRQANPVVWGDLFFTDSRYQSFQDATSAGDLYGIHFAETNESGVNELGVYRNVVGTSVGVNNFGHNTYGNYMDLVDTDVENFFGDIQTEDTESADSYLDVDGFGVNVIGDGDKVYGDGFEMLSLDDGRLADFDVNHFDAPGDETIAFKINLTALQYQPPIREQAADLGIDWIWDDEFAAIEDELETVEETLDDLQAEIKLRNKANRSIRHATPGFAEISARNSAANNLRKHQKNLAKYEALVATLEAKKAVWDAMTPADQASADPDLVWTRKDAEDLAYQTTENIPALQAKIQDIEATYTDAELRTAKQDHSDMLAQIRANNTELDANGEDYVAREQQMKALNAEKKAQSRLKQDLNEDYAQLDADIRTLLSDTRQALIAERMATAAEDATAAAALEADNGGPRTSADGGIPESEAELRAALNPETEVQDVPEPTTVLGLLALAGLGVVRLKRHN